MRLVALMLVVGLGACGGGGGSEGDVSGWDGIGGNDAGLDLAADESAPGDAAEDDLQVDNDVAVEPDNGGDNHVEPGEGALGDPCEADSDCQSTICWFTERGSGCTVECEKNADCSALGPLVCVYIREGLKACAPVVGQANAPCTQSAQCPYPTVCMTEFGWCEVPECTYDSECTETQICKPGFRVCEEKACESTYQCKNPLEFCFDGKCGPAQCSSSAECAEGEFCHPVQGKCQAADTCDGEGKCSYYNEICDNGLCVPNLCVTPCSHSGDVCNPATGKCGPPCTYPTACPAGWGCDMDHQVCYQNLAPAAVALVEKGGKLLPAANVMAGDLVKLVGSQSVDPEQKTLQYIWTIEDVPPGTNLTAGGPLSSNADTTFTPSKPGLYQFGLRVQDDTGVPSAQALVAVFAQ